MTWRAALACLLLTFGALGLTGQDLQKRHDLTVDDQPLEVIIDTLSELSDFHFSYNTFIFPPGSMFSIAAEGMLLTEILDQLFVGVNLVYKVRGDQIIITQSRSVFVEGAADYFSVSGTVRDQDSGELLPGVNVYLDGSSIGTVTNENGFFKLIRVPFGNYRIVFSHISFETKVFDFQRSDPSNLNIATELSFKTSFLEGVEISADRTPEDEDFLTYLAQFNDDFLGTGTNSVSCKIVNPEVLELTKDPYTNLLIASANAPLVIDNLALGYRLHCDLDEFRSTAESKNVRYVGKVRFEKLSPIDERQSKKWNSARQLAYEGSIRHFLKLVIDGKYRQKGYRAYLIDDIQAINETGLREARWTDFIQPSETEGLWKINFQKMLFITYSKELESDDYIIAMEREILRNMEFSANSLMFINRKPDVQRSLLKLNENNVLVDRNGNLTNPSGLSVSGYWSWERMSDLVPIDFDSN